jgi:signal transduction histidine kinase/CheY-like chemotaxis protein
MGREAQCFDDAGGAVGALESAPLAVLGASASLAGPLCARLNRAGLRERVFVLAACPDPGASACPPEEADDWVRLPVSPEEAQARLARAAGVLVERQRAQEAQRLLDARLSRIQKFESLGVLFAAAAHEYNNRLTAILGNASLAIREAGDEGRLASQIQSIYENATEASELTRQVLVYADNGRFQPQTVDVGRLLDDVRLLAGTLASPKTELRFEAAERLPPVRGDRGLLRQLVLNLVSNAADALGAQSGAVRVAAGAAEEAAFPGFTDVTGGEAWSEDGWLFIEVSDTGPGIETKLLGQILEPFWTTKSAGQGLGLPACRNIVRGHGGRLLIRTRPGEGTAVRALLPAVPAGLEEACPEPERPASASATAQAPDELGVLMVDDEAYVLEVTRTALERFGYRVFTAENGQEAVETYRQRRDEIDVVVLDLTMPVMDGAEAYRVLTGMNPDVPIVLSSGFSESCVRARFHADGRPGFLQKPYLPTDLRAAIEAAVLGGLAASAS